MKKHLSRAEKRNSVRGIVQQTDARHRIEISVVKDSIAAEFESPPRPPLNLWLKESLNVFVYLFGFFCGRVFTSKVGMWLGSLITVLLFFYKLMGKNEQYKDGSVQEVSKPDQQERYLGM